MKLIPQDHLDRSVTMATMEYMAAGVSNEDTVACKGDIVLLIRTSNAGGGQRYENLRTLGDDVVSALATDDVAFKVMKPFELQPLIEQLDRDLASEGLLEVEIHAFQFGSYHALYESTT